MALPRWRLPFIVATAAGLLASAQSALAQQVFPLPIPVAEAADVLLAVDNSGSMSSEIQPLQDALNAGALTDPLDAAGVDYEVLLVSKHGTIATQSLCIEEPLSGLPEGTCAVAVPGAPVPGPRFEHFSQEMNGGDLWCDLLFALDNPDENGFYPVGLEPELRMAARKTVIALSDDGVTCSTYNDSNTAAGGTTAAANFDADLLAAYPAQFGSALARNYVHHSIVGMTSKPDPTEPYSPGEPIETGECLGGAVAPGTGHQALSIATGGLRFASCETTSYAAILGKLAQTVVADAKSDWCERPLPDLMGGDPVGASLRLTPSAGPKEIFLQVVDLGACAGNQFFIEAGDVKLCPNACARVQADPAPALAVLLGVPTPVLSWWGVGLVLGLLIATAIWSVAPRSPDRK